MGQKFYEQEKGHFITRAFINDIHIVDTAETPDTTKVTMADGRDLYFEISPEDFVESLMAMKEYRKKRKKDRDDD